MTAGTFSATANPLTRIPDLGLHLRGSGANDTALGSTVTSWYDNSVAARNFTTTAGTKPSLEQVSSQFVSTKLMRSPQQLRLMKFDAGETISSDSLTLLKGKPGATCFLVSADYAAATTLLSIVKTGVVRFAVGHGRILSSADDTTTSTCDVTGVYTNTSRGWALTYGTVSDAIVTNHIASDGTKASTTVGPITPGFVNADATTMEITSAAAGYVAELAVYERKLNDTEIARVVAYLCHKYRMVR